MRHGQGKFFYQDGGMYEGKYMFYWRKLEI